MIQLMQFKTLTKNGKTYEMNRVGESICPNCLGVDGCMCALAPKQTPKPQKIEGGVEELKESQKKEFYEIVDRNWHRGAGEIIDTSKFFNEVLMWHNQELQKSMASEHQRCVEAILSALLESGKITIWKENPNLRICTKL